MIKQELATNFEKLREEQGASLPAWAEAISVDALSYFNKRGLPTRREEDWKYISLRPLQVSEFSVYGSEWIPRSSRGMREEGEDQALPPEGQRLSPEGQGLSPEGQGLSPEVQKTLSSRGLTAGSSYKLVFINGKFSAGHSSCEDLIDSEILLPLNKALEKHDDLIQDVLTRLSKQQRYPLTALNIGMLQDGYCLLVPKNKIIELPIHILHVSTDIESPSYNNAFNIIRLEANSQVEMLEEHVGFGSNNWGNFTHDITLNPGSKLTYTKLQNESSNNYHTDTFFVEQKKDSCLHVSNFSLRGAISRDDWEVNLNETGASCCMNGLYLPKGKDLHDHHLQINHNASYTLSDLFYKGVADDKGCAVFNGKVSVAEGVKQIQAYQHNPNLLLSKTAEINTKPELLIYADDVKCTHGATVGHLDKKALYYLRCRGLSYEDAMNMLLHAFVQEPVDKITNQAIKEYVHPIIQGIF